MLKNKKLWSISVGIDKYRDTRISPLHFAAADASVFHSAIVKTFDPAPDQSLLLTDEEATTTNVRTAIGERFARLAGIDDLVVIFFAGHGSPETAPGVDSAGRYLIMHDTQYDSIFATGFDLESDLVRLLQRLRSRQVLVIIDSCFSGRAGGRTFEGPALALQQQATRAPTVDLEHLELGEGRVVLSACDDWQVAAEDPELAHGVFTYHLLKTLATDDTEEETISVLTLYDQVATAVARQTAGLQHPVLTGRARLFRFPRLAQ